MRTFFFSLSACILTHLLWWCSVWSTTLAYGDAYQIVLAGGTGPIGQLVSRSLVNDDLIILARNAFLAATPNRVSEDYGWVGSNFMRKHPHVALRDWDGGDLTDIVGSDFLGWQDDCLPKAHILVHLTGGGFTQQRVMACERLVRESASFHPNIHHVTVNPTNELLPYLSPGIPTIKSQRIQECEDMVQRNCLYHTLLRMDSRKPERVSENILQTIQEIKQQQL